MTAAMSARSARARALFGPSPTKRAAVVAAPPTNHELMCAWWDEMSSEKGREWVAFTSTEQGAIVLAELVRLSQAAYSSGHKVFGIRVVWEIVRWSRTVWGKVADTGKESHRLPDRWTPFAALSIMKAAPELPDTFFSFGGADAPRRRMAALAATHGLAYDFDPRQF